MATLRCFSRALDGRMAASSACKVRGSTAWSTCPRWSHDPAGVADLPAGAWPYSTRALCAGVPLTDRRSGPKSSWLIPTDTLSCGHVERSLHTSTPLSGKRAWERGNKKVYPPQKPGEPPRMAEVYYSRRQIKHSMRKMWYIATFVKGMMIDDALTQLQFMNRKSAKIAREVLLEAQEEAVKNHNVEFKSNLHIAQSFVGKGEYDNAMRIHAKGRFSIMDLVYCHYFVCLKEGRPPPTVEATGYDQAQHYLDSLRKRTVKFSL